MNSDADSQPPVMVSPEQIQEVLQLVRGYRASQAIYVVVELGIPDLLASGPRDTDALAQATETHPGALFRILRFLAGVGLFDEISPRQFSLTALGATLCTDAPGSLRPTILGTMDLSRWQAWGQLLHSVRTGETAFMYVHGMEYFTYLGEHPQAAELFNQAMTSNVARSGPAITRAYDFSGVRRLVDVGGGQGLFVATVLQAYPALQGVLLDLPEVVAGASTVLEAAGVADRCQIVGGDFFTGLPADGDVYLLRQIVHDWDDARAAAILENCRRAMAPAGKVLVIESTIAPEYQQAMPALELDLEMLVILGGQQRTEAEYRALFATAGFQLSRVMPLGDGTQFSVFEGVPA